MKFYVLLALSALLASCGTSSEEIWINADGSGKYVFDYDAGEMLGMLEMMGAMDKDESSEDELPSSDEADPEVMFKSIAKKERFDTSFNIASMLPDSIKRMLNSDEELKAQLVKNGQQATDARVDSIQRAFELLSELNMAMRMDKEKGVLGFGFETRFDNPNSIMKTFEGMQYLQNLSPQANNGPSSGIMSSMGNRSSYQLDGNTVKIMLELPQKLDELLEQGSEEINTEEIEGMLGMMGLDKHEITIHLPGIFKKAEGIEVRQLNENTVVIPVDYLDMLKTGSTLAATITFKKKRKYRNIANK